MKISDIPRNDIEAAMQFYKECVAAGTWTPSRAHSVLMLQDDPDTLIDAINAEKGRARVAQ